MIWLETEQQSGGEFKDEAVPETDYCRDAPLGTQVGTYWKTGRTHKGMTVWTWGGLSEEDRRLILSHT